jgi:hypothetical protein
MHYKIVKIFTLVFRSISSKIEFDSEPEQHQPIRGSNSIGSRPRHSNFAIV